MNGKLIFLFMAFILLVLFILPIVSAQQCDTAQVKVALKKVLYQYYRDPSSATISVDRIRDLLAFYLSIPSNQQYADCNIKGSESNKKMQQIMDDINALIITLPQCKDGTVYGECSSTLPLYCFNGNLVNKCSLCGCPSGTGCVDNSCVSTTTPPPPTTNMTNGTITPTEFCGDTICSSTETCSSCNVDCGSCPTWNLSAINVSNLSGEVRITTNSADQRYVEIYGNRIVWVDWRQFSGTDANKYSLYANADIYMYDLSTGTEKQITTNPLAQVGPAIYGDKVVWGDFRNGAGNADIYMYDVSTGTETQITTAAGNQGNPHIYQNKIVWSDERESNSEPDIYLYDLTSGTETKVSRTKGLNFGPRIYSDKIVWAKSVWVGAHSQYDIYLHDLTTGTETKVTTGPDSKVSPDIYGNQIVWYTQYEGGTTTFNVYVYDINTKKKTQITSHPYTNFSPRIYGNKVVWMDYRSGSNSNPDIFMYDLSTGKETQITTHPGIQSRPAIYGNKIVWEDYRNGNADIYLTTIS